MSLSALSTSNGSYVKIYTVKKNDSLPLHARIPKKKIRKKTPHPLDGFLVLRVRQ